MDPSGHAAAAARSAPRLTRRRFIAWRNTSEGIPTRNWTAHPIGKGANGLHQCSWAKGHIDLDEHQVRTWDASHCHLTLAMTAYLISTLTLRSTSPAAKILRS
jgi:hypothetical protein